MISLPSTRPRTGGHAPHSTQPFGYHHRGLQHHGEDREKVRPRGPDGDANREGCCAERGGNFDVTLPLRTASGKVIGALGLTFKPQANEQEPAAVERAKKMASELER